ncbi:hypothetical protein FOA52_010022 [Chlamydomonas sp. UWO 241]|nr:hypothetical protein FOA52_010022 [Chlamydomonas sp. UWO 241]
MLNLNRVTVPRASSRSARSNGRAVVSCASHNAQHPSASQMLASSTAAMLLLMAGPVGATGLESPDIPSLRAPDALRDAYAQMKSGTQTKLDAVDSSFAQSDTLKRLLEQSKANQSKNKREIQDKYCYRQAELGIGDCGGLNLIPGMTEGGKQPTPKWLADLLGVEVPASVPEGKGIQDLFDRANAKAIEKEAALAEAAAAATAAPVEEATVVEGAAAE